jgi:hypothetical protein
MDKKLKLITRNYSRKEGSEMFSLTMTREIEADSTFYRQRAENYIALYDVQIQLLEEMAVIGYVEKDFLIQRKKGIANQLNSLMKFLEKEIESGNLSLEQVYMNESTIDEIYIRLGSAMPERKQLTVNYKGMSTVEVVADVVEEVAKEEVVAEIVTEVAKEEVVAEVVKEEVVKEEVVAEIVAEVAKEVVAEESKKEITDEVVAEVIKEEVAKEEVAKEEEDPFWV